MTADELWGHNIVGYDYQAIRDCIEKKLIEIYKENNA